MAETVLITGGAGFIGSHLVLAAVGRGWRVRLLDNLATGSRRNLAPVERDIDFLEDDLRDPDACFRACRAGDVRHSRADITAARERRGIRRLSALRTDWRALYHSMSRPRSSGRGPHSCLAPPSERSP